MRILFQGIAICAAVMLAACSVDPVVRPPDTPPPVCGDGVVDVSVSEVCDDGNQVGGDGCAADCRSNETCGNGEVVAPEECDDGDTNDADDCVVGTSLAYACKLARCGDGIVATNATGPRKEQCDGGAADHSSPGPVETSTCNLDCTVSACGDGKVNGHANEQCDDGNNSNGDGCDSNCKPTGCGNSIQSAGEGCDDGNLVNGDGCDSNCKPTGCGNGIVTGPEQCDDGNSTNGDGCDNDCTATACGNDIPTTGEACDDGNSVNGDGCDNNCTPTGCRNGIVTAGETCDDGNSVNGDGCDNNCTASACGNGALSGFEACDDGNVVDGDGCDSNCRATGCGNGVVTAGEQCDDSNAANNDGCDNNCTPTGCGNGVVAGTELCDDGNLTNNDGCDSNCKPSGCGNGVVTGGEQCDDGNTVNGDGCDSNCQATGCGNGVIAGFEVCDDGNLTNSDGCDQNCTPTGCGNHVVTPLTGEACDDGNQTNGDGCDNNCRPTSCGNGITAGTEQCDDGNSSNGDGCDNNCTLTACGNHVVTAGEQCDDGNSSNGDGCDQNCTPTQCGNGVVTTGEQCDDGNQTNGDGCDNDCIVRTIAYGKASNTDPVDLFGFSVALSADGSTLVVGAPLEDSAATGINGDQSSNAAGDSGAVYVFTRSGATWVQQAYIKASNTDSNDIFGYSVALSADGSTLAVGACAEDSTSTGINGDQSSNGAIDSGAVYVFTRSGTAWSQQAYVKASNTDSGDQFCYSVALSGDGSTLAVGTNLEDGVANSTVDSGAAYVFTRSGATWSQQAYVTASNVDAGDNFGYSIALSSDGSTLAVGSPDEDSAATGINGDHTSNSASVSGAAYVFTRIGSVWSQQAYVKASNTEAGDLFGYSITLSGDGSTLAVGAVAEDSAATGINGNQADNSVTDSGAIYIFARSGTTWAQQAYVKASNTDAFDTFGVSVALSGDGSSLAVGAYLEDSAATGINGDQSSDSVLDAGAVYAFARNGATWSQQAYVKASNTEALDVFGICIGLSADGSTMAVGAYTEDSAATGVGGDQTNNSASASGAVYVFD